ncbi:MAG: hypothetical protein H6733_11695 [Alphaproteobacteria bacterium]|nr:hypothetical protein [Alphaproteobacteria bacterium]
MPTTFPAADDQSITLEVLDADATSGGDRIVIVSVNLGASTGSVDCWVLAAAWHAFITSLTALERTRSGSARLESLSPGELALEFFDVNARGHIGVRGAIGHLCGTSPWTLSFDALTLDAEHFGGAVASLARRTV